MQSLNIAGPVFASIGHLLSAMTLLCFIPLKYIGEGDQLKVFLDNNPRIPKNLMLVDDYSLKAYKALNLKNLGDDVMKMKDKASNMQLPQLRSDEALAYLTNVAKLAPMKGFPLQVPEGVLRLGATFGVRGDNLVYVYEDAFPGDHPAPTQVIDAVASGRQ